MCVNEAGSIRLMEEKDVEQVEELEKQCFSVPWSENILKDGLTGRFDTYLVWEKDGIVAGYCALRVLADKGEIQRIAVHLFFLYFSFSIASPFILLSRTYDSL